MSNKTLKRLKSISHYTTPNHVLLINMLPDILGVTVIIVSLYGSRYDCLLILILSYKILKRLKTISHYTTPNIVLLINILPDILGITVIIVSLYCSRYDCT